MNAHRWQSLPILDALRPESGWKTDHAILGSYSADPVALVAILLALAGRDDERGSGTAIDFAEAIEELRGKVSFLIQCGRISVPFRAQTVLKVMDNFVKEINCDETTESWHPKVALIRQSSIDADKVCWRFWMGSRNFTRDRSWDAGLLLVGNVEEKGRPVPGLIESARELWDKAGVSRANQKIQSDELRLVRWVHPQGCKVEEIKILLPQDADRGLPAEPRKMESLLVVSPFLDGGTVEALGKWGNQKTHRTLVSTYRALSGIANQTRKPLQRYLDSGEVLFMDDFDEDESLAVPTIEASLEESSDDTEEDHTGLHAKLILARRRGQSSLWLGSPNMTHRAWKKNYEIVAKLSVCDDITQELIKFTKGASTFESTNIKSELDPKEPEIIEVARKQVVSRWQVKQKDWTLYAAKAPHPDNPHIVLEVGFLGSKLVQWPRNTKVLKLHRESPPIETELVQIRISYKKAELRWLQKTQLYPIPDVERDRRAIATLFKPSRFMEWLRSILDDELPPGGEPWDHEQRRKEPRGKPTRLPLINRETPTLEDILKAWSRNPAVLRVVDERMKAYVDFIYSSGNEETEELLALKEFEKVWKTLREELIDQE